MKKIILLTILTLSSFSYAVSETAKGVKKDYEKFKVEMNKELDDLEVKINDLKAKAKTKGSETQDKTIQELEKSRSELKAELSELKKSGESNWKKFKKNFAESVDSLNKKIQKSLED